MKDRAYPRVYGMIATVFGAGYLPVAPGTWGSLAGLAACYLTYRVMPVYITLFVLSFVAGVLSSDRVEKATGEKDPSFIVIDEFACIFPVFFFVPLTLFTATLGFVIYRIIDIVKVYPMSGIERLHGGWGIMLDDLIGGVYTGILLWVIMRLFAI